MSIGYVCNRDVVILNRKTPINEAVQVMREHHVGNVVVVEEGSKGRIPVGILTDRDVLLSVVARQIEMAALVADDVMSTDLLCAREEQEVLDVIECMREHGVRRVPVVDAEGSLVGIVTLDDLIGIVAQEMAGLLGVITRQQKKEKELR